MKSVLLLHVLDSRVMRETVLITLPGCNKFFVFFKKVAALIFSEKQVLPRHMQKHSFIVLYIFMKYFGKMIFLTGLPPYSDLGGSNALL